MAGMGAGMSQQEEAFELLKELIDNAGFLCQSAIYSDVLDLKVWMDKAKSIVRGHR